MNLAEQRKYEKAYTIPRYGKDWSVGGATHKRLFRTFAKPSTVVDVGCGNGSSLRWLTSEGYTPTGLDIARNCCKSPYVVADIVSEQSRNIGLFDYGFCVDVLEHIPPNDVSAAIANIRAIVRRGVYFHIAIGPDKDGEQIGEVLHLSIFDRDWWHMALGKQFPLILELRNIPQNSYTVFASCDDVFG